MPSAARETYGMPSQLAKSSWTEPTMGDWND